MTKQPLNEADIDALMLRAAETLAQYADEQAAPGMAHAVAVRAVIKSYTERALKSIGLTGGRGDARTRQWHIEATYQTTAPGGAPLTLLVGHTVCDGFDRVAKWLKEGADYAFHDRGGLPEACYVHTIFDKLQNLRPTITRRKGIASMRYNFPDRHGRPSFLRAIILRSDAWERREAQKQALGVATAETNRETVRNLRAGRPVPATGPSVVAPGELDD